jgi:hypothetical protein
VLLLLLLLLLLLVSLLTRVHVGALRSAPVY